MPSKLLAPIAVFVYKRPEHTRRLLESLAENPEAAKSELWIFCEGPRDESEWPAINAVRAIARSRPWAGTTKLIESDVNLGCANSVMAGVEAVLAQHDRIIVLEEDLVLSPHFLSFMNEALIRYDVVDRVMQVSGYMFNVELPSESDLVVLPFISSWGWATWRRAWTKFDPMLGSLAWLDRWRWRRYRFDLYGTFPYRKMLDRCLRGEVDSWAIRWYLSVFRCRGLAVYPRKSLVINKGFADGTHTSSARFESTLAEAFSPRRWPTTMASDTAALKKLGRLFYGGHRPIYKRLRQFIWGC